LAFSCDVASGGGVARYRGECGRAGVVERRSAEADGRRGGDRAMVGEREDELIERLLNLAARLELVRQLVVHVAAQTAHLPPTTHTNAGR